MEALCKECSTLYKVEIGIYDSRLLCARILGMITLDILVSRCPLRAKQMLYESVPILGSKNALGAVDANIVLYGQRIV